MLGMIECTDSMKEEGEGKEVREDILFECLVYYYMLVHMHDYTMVDLISNA